MHTLAVQREISDDGAYGEHVWSSSLQVCMGMGVAFGLLIGMGVGITSWEWEWHICTKEVLFYIATCSDR